MKLRWRLTLSTIALIAPLLLFLFTHDLYNLRNFLIERESIRLRAQAKPIIDAELLNRKVDDEKLRAIADRLATDLSSIETGASIVDRYGREIGRHNSTIGEPAAPQLPKDWYASALAGELKQDHIIKDRNGSDILVALVPIPPRQTPLGVAVLSTSLESSYQLVRQHVLSTVVACLILLTIAVIAIFLMVRSNLRPLEYMAVVAYRIAQGDLSQRSNLKPGMNEIGQLARSFDEMVDRLQSALAVKTQSEDRLRQFLADVSHELRTPLTVIGGYADLLLRGVVTTPEENTRLLRAMRREINRTERLVRDLLLLVRSDRAATFEMQAVNLSELCTEIAAQFSLMMGQRVFQSYIPKKVVVLGDPDRIEQVLSNILDNAIRHTPEQTRIDLRLKVIGNSAWIEIADTGRGIPSDLLEHIFERFHSGQQQGTGLGLAIARAIVEAHGGTIMAFNQPRGGACFIVELPLYSEE
ncbi:HAMP domain-containing sensor histidine kinase [Chroococcidiopsis sp. CCNUC1]|uniref:sensor histidine kinase n=1 Tax=Chroococcidiopsis sp. CCNUC1 TaxID=2653189 RepID=UPI0020205733|nr:HAMP domain-containing sensor histidine kinase [Chroococcidiopsis sp. CCNUC1]URD51290.1 HAMP domain-containing histidine kinase [Chroococcidiopsis sp. CCNUC1]